MVIDLHNKFWLMDKVKVEVKALYIVEMDGTYRNILLNGQCKWNFLHFF